MKLWYQGERWEVFERIHLNVYFMLSTKIEKNVMTVEFKRHIQVCYFNTRMWSLSLFSTCIILHNQLVENWQPLQTGRVTAIPIEICYYSHRCWFCGYCGDAMTQVCPLGMRVWVSKAAKCIDKNPHLDLTEWIEPVLWGGEGVLVKTNLFVVHLLGRCYLFCEGHLPLLLPIYTTQRSRLHFTTPWIIWLILF